MDGALWETRVCTYTVCTAVDDGAAPPPTAEEAPSPEIATEQDERGNLCVHRTPSPPTKTPESQSSTLRFEVLGISRLCQSKKDTRRNQTTGARKGHGDSNSSSSTRTLQSLYYGEGGSLFSSSFWRRTNQDSPGFRLRHNNSCQVGGHANHQRGGFVIERC